MKHSNPNKAFAKGKDRWASTLKSSSQNVSVVGRTSQNKPTRKGSK